MQSSCGHKNMLASSAAEQTGCNSGEAASPVSWFVQRVGPVFLSGTSNMLILLGRCLKLSLYLQRRIALWSPQHHQLHADNQVCVHMIISPVSKLSLPTFFGALAHCCRLQAPLETRRCKRHNSQKSEHNFQGSTTMSMLIMSYFGRAG